MGTGTKRANITNKMVLGYQDLSVRIFDYLREQVRESIQARWDVDGVFDTKLTLSSAAPNTVSVVGTSLCTDGLGHILDVNGVYPNANAVFQNTNAITYYVGMSYAATPSGVTINPRTGKPQIQSWVDQIGFAAAPTLVTDNGDGTMTFRCDSGLFESGVSSAGRKVIVYKKVLADSALTESLAFEELTVQWSGSHNFINTIHAFGQNTVSTDVNDYTIVGLGIGVKRNTNLSTDPSYTFIGTVIGVGLGGTPAVFNNTNQRLLKTFNDASQVLIDSYKWLTAGTVQEGLEQIVDTLDKVTATPGAARIGVLTTAFAAAAPFASQPAGGLGNNADGTFTGASRLQDVLLEIDTILRRRQSVTATFGDGTYATDYSRTDFNLSKDVSGVYFLRHLANMANPFTITSLGTSIGIHSKYVGERSDVGDTPENKEHIHTLNDTGITDAIIHGHFERVYFDCAHSGPFVIGHSVGANVIMEDWGARAGRVAISDMVAGLPQPFHLRNGRIRRQSSGETTFSGSSLLIKHSGGDQWVHGLIENMVIEGPGTGGSPVSNVSCGLTANITSGLIRPFTFRNCVFIQSSANVPCVKMTGEYKIVFENCSFIGASGLTSVLFQATVGANVVLRDCYFYAPEGQAAWLQGVAGGMYGCQITTEGATTQANTNPQILIAYGQSFGSKSNAFFMSDNLVVIGDGATRPSGSVANKSLVELGSSSENPIHVSGMHIRYASPGASALHRAPTLSIISADGVSTFTDVVVDLNSLTRSLNNEVVNGFTGLVQVAGAVVKGLQVRNTATPGTALNTVIVAVYKSQVRDLWIDCGFGCTNSLKWAACLQMETETVIDGLTLVSAGAVVGSNGVIYIGGSNSGKCTISNMTSNGVFCGVGAPAFINVAHDENILDKIKMWGVKQNICPTILINDSNRNIITDCKIINDGITVGSDVISVTGGSSTTHGRANIISHNFIEWNGNSDYAINHNAYDGNLLGNILRRVSGATAGITTIGGADNTTEVNSTLTIV